MASEPGRTKAILRLRLRERLDATGLSALAVSKEIGANTGYVRDLLDPDKTSIPSAERIERLARALGTTTDWLLGRADSPAQPLSEVSFRDAPQPWHGTERDGIPLLGTAFCDGLAVEGPDGAPLQVERVLLDADHVIRLIARPPALWAARDAYAIYCHGDSMEPRYRQGEVAVVDPRRPPGPGDDVVVQLTDGNGGSDVVTVLLKQLVRATASYIELAQFNPPLTFRVPRSQVARLHRVVSLAEMLG